MTVYPGSEFSVPTLELGREADGGLSSRLYPMMKVHRRLCLGRGESLPAFYRMVATRLLGGAASESAQKDGPQGVAGSV